MRTLAALTQRGVALAQHRVRQWQMAMYLTQVSSASAQLRDAFT